jgi:hypothetical protein
MPLISIDGPNYAGKTTLANELMSTWYRIKEPFGTDLASARHIVIPLEQVNNPDVHKEAIDDYDPTDIQHLRIIEHSFPSSYVDSTLYHHANAIDEYGVMGETQMRLLEASYSGRGGVLALLLPDVETLQVRASNSDNHDKPETHYLDSRIRADIEAEPRAETTAHDDSWTERRLYQLTLSSNMHSFFLRYRGDSFDSYRRIGYPYYVSPESVVEPHGQHAWSDGWPPISFEMEVRHVAADILHKAMDAQSLIIDELADLSVLTL